MIAPLPPNEAQRLQALHRCNLLDTSAEAIFDDFTRLAALLCGAPVSLISLVDADRQWFKARCGMVATETHRDHAFCAHAILQPEEVLLVPDALCDPRFADNTLVTGDPHIRFYAGVPLVTRTGQALGTLCVIDRVPRQLTSEQIESLRILGRQVMAQIEMRDVISTRHRAEEQIELVMTSLSSLLISLDEQGNVTQWNPSAEALFALPAQRVIGQPFRECGISWDWQMVDQAIIECANGHCRVSLDNVPFEAVDGKQRLLGLTLNPFKRHGDTPTGFLLAGADVTERRQAENALRESQERLQLALHAGKQAEEMFRQLHRRNELLLQSVGDGIFGLDKNGHAIFVNPVCAQMLGYEVEEMLGQNLYALLRPSQPDGTPYPLTRSPIHLSLFRGAPCKNNEGIFWHREHRQVPIEYTSTPILEDEEIVGVVVTFRDITARQAAERQLKESRDRMATLVDAIPDLLYRVNRAGICLEAMLEGRDHVLFKTEECLGHHLRSFVPKDVADTMLEAIGEALASHRVQCHEYQLMFAEQKYYREARFVPQSNDEVLIIVRDITERKQAEQRLYLLEAAVENAKDVVLISEAEPINQPGPRVIYVNEAFEQMTGYRREEIIGKTPRILQGPRTDPQTCEYIRKRLKAWKPTRVELLNYRKDGTEFWVELNIRPIADATGWYTHWIAIQRDITARKKSEKDLEEAAQELERRNVELVEARDAALAAARMKSEFLANTSHEVRTPLNGIMGIAYLLQNTRLDTEQQNYVQLIERSANALLTILNDILDFSKIEAGKMTVESIPCSLSQVVEDAAALLQPRADEKQVTLQHRFLLSSETQDADYVLGDPGRLRQVLLNLIGNAIKFTESGGQVMVTGELRSQTSVQACWRFSIRDTGIGVPESQVNRIFESFTQADGSTTRRFGGTGLGLTICRQLVTLMGGQIGVKSVVGKGSTFWIEVTLEKCFEREATGPSGRLLAAGNKASVDHVSLRSESLLSGRNPLDLVKSLRLLLAEDNAINQIVACEMFVRLGIDRERLTVVSSGQEALERLHSERYDLVFMDVHMPNLDGIEATQQWRTYEHDQALASTPIVAMTAHCLPGDRERFLTVGMNDYIAKPVEAKVLESVVLRWAISIAAMNTAGSAAEESATLDPDLSLSQRSEGAAGAEATLSDSSSSADDPFDAERLRSVTGGDQSLCHRLLEEFALTAPRMLARCEIALEMHDPQNIERWAHTFKGSCATLGAHTLTPLCQQLELAGKHNDLQQSAALLNSVQTEWQRVEPYLQQRLAQNNPSCYLLVPGG